MSNETGWTTPHFGLSNHTNCEDSSEMILNSDKFDKKQSAIGCQRDLNVNFNINKINK